MVLTLYATIGSPPCHQVLLTAKLLNLDLEVKPVDIRNAEHLTPEYLKINPQHTVPTLADGDFSLWESRAISRYLVNKYGADSKLYPQDPQARAVVDQRLDFDLGTLSMRFTEYFYPQLLGGAPPDAEKLKKLQDAIGLLNTFLESNEYTAGPDLTIADVALVSTISTIDIIDISLKEFPNVVRWFELMKTTSGYQEAIQKNVDITKGMIEQLRQAKKNETD